MPLNGGLSQPSPTLNLPSHAGYTATEGLPSSLSGPNVILVDASTLPTRYIQPFFLNIRLLHLFFKLDQGGGTARDGATEGWRKRWPRNNWIQPYDKSLSIHGAEIPRRQWLQKANWASVSHQKRQRQCDFHADSWANRDRCNELPG